MVQRAREHQLLIRLNFKEMMHINNECLELGMNQSAYVREHLFSKNNKIYVFRNVKTILSELRKIGNNINQIAKTANTQGYVNQSDIDYCVKQINVIKNSILFEIYQEVPHWPPQK